MNLQSPIALAGALTLSVLPGAFFLASAPSDPIELPAVVSEQKARVIPEISLPTPILLPEFPTPTALTQLLFSMDPPRPSSIAQRPIIRVQFAEGKEQRSVSTPARIGLEWDERGALRPGSSPELFWLQVESPTAVSLHYKAPSGEIISPASWEPMMQETPLRTAETFDATSPFQELAQAKFGTDVLAEKYGSAATYRLEAGTSSFPVKPDEWLVFRDKRWQPIAQLDEAGNLPIARLKIGLEFEGWDGSSYVRFRPQAHNLQPLRIRGDELFSQLRVRSEKQVSCMLDKQCLVLRPGDWVLKTENRWKIVRRAEEKTKLLEGTLSGDLFVLDRVEARGPTKSISGQYIAANRLQSVPIEKSVTATRKK